MSKVCKAHSIVLHKCNNELSHCHCDPVYPCIIPTANSVSLHCIFMHLSLHLSLSGGNSHWFPHSPYNVGLLKRNAHALVTLGGPWGPEDPPAEVDNLSEG